MSEQSAKKLRTPAQQAANKAASERAKKIAEESKEFFQKTGLPARVPYPAMYAKMKKEGKSDDEIAAAIKQKMNNTTATRKAKSANKAAAKAVAQGNLNNEPLGATAAQIKALSKPAPASAPSTPKAKSAAKEAADKAQSNTGQKFKNRGLKAYPQAVSYYIMQKKAGKSDETIFEEIKGKPNLQKAPARTKKNNAAKKGNAVAAVAPLAANKGANVVVANKGVAKGQYVCDRCRLVANNTTRKNNKKNNASPSYYNNQGEYF